MAAPIPPPSSNGPLRFPVARPSSVVGNFRRPTALTTPPLRLSSPSRATIDSNSGVGFTTEDLTRVPFGPGAELVDPLPAERLLTIERSLRLLESQLDERQQQLDERQLKLAERERDLAEIEALLIARENLLVAERRSASARPAASAATVSPEEQAALAALRTELERRESSIQEAAAALKEREAFVEKSESMLFSKVQEHQEREMELDQRAEELTVLTRRLRLKEAAVDPDAAAALQEEAEAPPKKMDEFNE